MSGSKEYAEQAGNCALDIATALIEVQKCGRNALDESIPKMRANMDDAYAKAVQALHRLKTITESELNRQEEQRK